MKEWSSYIQFRSTVCRGLKVKGHLDDIGEHRVVTGDEDDALFCEKSADDLQNSVH